MDTLTLPKFPRPVTGDCTDYYFLYIDKVGDEDIIKILTQQQTSFSDFISQLTPEQLHFRYAPGKWSLAEMIGHIFDTERIFAYRMLCISRGEQKSLPGFEQDDYVAASNANDWNQKGLIEEWNAIRASTILLCKHMTAEMALREGQANDHPVKAYAYPYILAGHVMHHLEVAKERYLKPA